MHWLLRHDVTYVVTPALPRHEKADKVSAAASRPNEFPALHTFARRVRKGVGSIV